MDVEVAEIGGEVLEAALRIDSLAVPSCHSMDDPYYAITWLKPARTITLRSNAPAALTLYLRCLVALRYATCLKALS
jgi:hypothetical protein